MPRRTVDTTFRSPYGRPPAGGVLSLTGLEDMTKSERTAAVKAVATDMAASIIYIARQAEAGNLTPDQTTPIYNLISDITLTERGDRDALLRDLESREREISRMRRIHRRDLRAISKAAIVALGKFRRRIRELEAEIKGPRPGFVRIRPLQEDNMDVNEDTVGEENARTGEPESMVE